MQHVVNRGLSLSGGARLDGRFHPKHGDYDQFGYTLSGGLAKVLGRDVVRGSLLWNGMQLDYDTYRTLTTATVDRGRNLDPQTQVGAYSQLGDIDYTATTPCALRARWAPGCSWRVRCKPE